MGRLDCIASVLSREPTQSTIDAMLNGLNQPEEWQATPARLGCLGCLDAVDVTMVSPVRDSYYPSSPSMSFLTLMVSDAFCQIIYIYIYYIYIRVCVYIFIYVYVYIYNMCIYIYVYMYICIYVYMYKVCHLGIMWHKPNLRHLDR